MVKINKAYREIAGDINDKLLEEEIWYHEESGLVWAKADDIFNFLRELWKDKETK